MLFFAFSFPLLRAQGASSCRDDGSCFCYSREYRADPTSSSPAFAGSLKTTFFKLSFPMSTTTYAAAGLKTIDTGCYNGIRRSLAGPSTVRGADASVESVWGRRSRPNEPQRKSDTDTRVDPKTSPVPRLEGNPPAVRRAFLFYGKKARRASVSILWDSHAWLSQTTRTRQPPTQGPFLRPILANAGPP